MPFKSTNLLTARRSGHVDLLGRVFGRPLRPEVSGLPGHQVQAQEAGQKLGNVEATHVRKPGKLKILVLPTVKLAQGEVRVASIPRLCKEMVRSDTGLD